MSVLDIPRKHWIYGALTFVSLLGAILKVTVLDDLGYGIVTWYLGFLYVMFVAWSVAQLRMIHQREQDESAAPSEAMAPVRPPTEDELRSAATYLDLGESLETVCQFVEPHYREWKPAEKQAFRSQLRAAIDERRARAGASPESI
jgi:hypothetical protein